MCTFLLVVQLCALSSVWIGQNALLQAAQKQSDFDLAVYDQARAFAGRNAYRRRCLSGMGIEEEYAFEVQGTQVELTDHETYVEAQWRREARTIRLRLYYSSSGIVSSEYV